MIHKFTAVLACCLAVSGAPAMAGPGHSHDHGHGHSHGAVSSEAASEKAVKKVAQLAESGKIDASWAGLKPTSVEQKSYANGPEWVVVFNNSKVSDAEKRTLYLFYSLEGHYIAANYTGQ